MPLSKGKSKAAFSKNIKTEVAVGKPVKQAVAIAYNEKRHSPPSQGNPGHGTAKDPHGGQKLDIQGDTKGYPSGHYAYGEPSRHATPTGVKHTSVYGPQTGQKKA